MTGNTTKKNNQPPIFNELYNGIYSVDCQLNPEINPAEWAELCRDLGSMPLGLFYAFREGILAAVFHRNDEHRV